MRKSELIVNLAFIFGPAVIAFLGVASLSLAPLSLLSAHLRLIISEFPAAWQAARFSRRRCAESREQSNNVFEFRYGSIWR